MSIIAGKVMMQECMLAAHMLAAGLILELARDQDRCAMATVAPIVGSRSPTSMEGERTIEQLKTSDRRDAAC